MTPLTKRATWLAYLQTAGNRVFDRAFGTDTARSVGLPGLGFGPEVGSPYQASNWVNLIGLARMLRELEIDREDVFLDLGCGKGQVLFVAAHFPFARVVGLDLSEAMISIARRDLDGRRRGFRAGGVELIAGDAAGFEFPPDVNTCYLYNPFPRPVMAQVLAGMDASLAEHPRTMRVLYLEAADGDLLLAQGFRETRRIRRLRLYVSEPS